MLIELADYRHARAVLDPVLGTEWADHAHRLLDEIRVAIAPRVSAAVVGRRDDQPLSLVGTAVDAQAHLTPAASLALRVRPSWFTVDGDVSSPPVAATVTQGEVVLSHYHARAFVRTEIGVGAVRWTGQTSDLIGHATIGRRMSSLISLGARVDRRPYLSTIASLSTPVVSTTAQVTMDMSHRGWLGQAAASAQRFPDANTISTIHGWLVAPVLRSAAADIHAGYAVSAQNADASRATSRGANGVRYDPYYTPANHRSHAATGALRWTAASRLTMRVNGSYGWAREDAPYFSNGQRGAATRTFHPRTIRASVDAGPFSGVRVRAEAERMRTAFYTATSGQAGVEIVLARSRR
jgi:hypothetical protein